MQLGNCFEAAGEYMVDKCCFDDEQREHLRLVHGRVTRSLPPHIKYNHAWIEVNGETVIDPDQELTATVEDYYRAGRVDVESCVRYTYDVMAALVREYNHWGPWELEELPEEVEYRKTLMEEQSNDI